MKEILDFLEQLAANNNKPWFDEHKEEYKVVKARFDAFAMDFLHGVEAFEPRVRGLGVKDITYRIYRDLRFSKDKRPYKEWHGVYVCPNGKKSGMAGYYIHLEPATDTYFLCGGLYNPTKEVLRSVREGFMLEGDDFKKALKECPDFQLPWDEALRRVPQGYNEQDEYSKFYRLRSFTLLKSVTKREVLNRDFLSHALEDLRRTHAFNELLNKCYDYAMEEGDDNS